MSSFNLMQMVFPFASLFKEQFGKCVIHKAFLALPHGLSVPACSTRGL